MRTTTSSNFEILAQELALQDMDDPPITEENYDEVMNRMNAYLGSSGLQHRPHLRGHGITLHKICREERTPGRFFITPTDLSMKEPGTESSVPRLF